MPGWPQEASHRDKPAVVQTWGGPGEGASPDSLSLPFSESGSDLDEELSDFSDSEDDAPFQLPTTLGPAEVGRRAGNACVSAWPCPPLCRGLWQSAASPAARAGAAS